MPSAHVCPPGFAFHYGAKGVGLERVETVRGAFATLATGFPSAQSLQMCHKEPVFGLSQPFSMGVLPGKSGFVAPGAVPAARNLPPLRDKSPSIALAGCHLAAKRRFQSARHDFGRESDKVYKNCASGFAQEGGGPWRREVCDREGRRPRARREAISTQIGRVGANLVEAARFFAAILCPQALRPPGRSKFQSRQARSFPPWCKVHRAGKTCWPCFPSGASERREVQGNVASTPARGD